MAPTAPFPDPPMVCITPALCVAFAAVALALLEEEGLVPPVLEAELDDLPLVDVAMVLEFAEEPPGAAALPVEAGDEPLEVED